mmetsp:Transcript_55036/g.144746  ORF Transcript_55036/g.144746 Transcript_55036/m.144746 type:complete len:209 (+) Transcript_55036:261-887(+)
MVLRCQSRCERWAALALVSSSCTPFSRLFATWRVSRCFWPCSSRIFAIRAAWLAASSLCCSASSGRSLRIRSSSSNRAAFSSSSGVAFRWGRGSREAAAGSSAGSCSGYILASSSPSLATLDSSLLTSCCIGEIAAAARLWPSPPSRMRLSSSSKSFRPSLGEVHLGAACCSDATSSHVSRAAAVCWPLFVPSRTAPISARSDSVSPL